LCIVRSRSVVSPWKDLQPIAIFRTHLGEIFLVVCFCDSVFQILWAVSSAFSFGRKDILVWFDDFGVCRTSVTRTCCRLASHTSRPTTWKRRTPI
jgi:hypothetical protein